MGSDEEDRISRLPDDLIHKILSFVDAEDAVQTSVLSKRWKLVWTTLPSLNWYLDNDSDYDKIFTQFFSNRNYQSHIFELKLFVCHDNVPRSLVNKLVEYAIEHNVQDLHLSLHFYRHNHFKLSTFNSKSLKKLTLKRIRLADSALESDCWDLPALTSLHLVPPVMYEMLHIFWELPGSCLTCLPALTTLCLKSWDLSISSSFSFSLPKLTTLRLIYCKLPETSWDFPALSSLDLLDIKLPDNMSDIFSTLVNLQNLTLTDWSMQRDHFISCPLLVNLTISTSCYMSHSFVVLAPKLSTFFSVGIFPITFGVPELKKVDMKLDSFVSVYHKNKKIFHPQFTSMLLGLGNARYFTFDLGSIQALSDISNLLVSLPSPFYDLKYVKLPRGFKESSIPSALRSFLLGASARATIVTDLP